MLAALVGCSALWAAPAAAPGPGIEARGEPSPGTDAVTPGGESGSATGSGDENGNGTAPSDSGVGSGTGDAANPGAVGEGSAEAAAGNGTSAGGGDGAASSGKHGAGADVAPRTEPADPRQVTIAFTGDIMLTRIPGEYLASGEDPFAGVADALTAADLTIGNLECVVATVGEPVPKWWNFRCHPRVVPVLARYFDAVSVANNHSGDYGKEAFAEQLQILKEGGLPYFGGGMNFAEAHQPLILERNGLKVAILGYNNVELRSYEAGPDTPGLAWIELDQLAADVQAARAQADIVVVYPHWGYDYMPWHAEDQAEIARVAIDAGADLVVGNHPHVTQPVELYNGRLIAYSLGNFVFDDFVDVGPELQEAARTSWVLTVTVGKDGIRHWETRVARTDDRGFPQWVEGVASPCSDGAPEDGFLCYP